MQVSAEIALLLQQEQDWHRKREEGAERKKHWNNKVALAVELLKKCATVGDSVPSAEIVQELWIPTAVAVVACVSPPRLREIPLEHAGPMCAAVVRLFFRGAEDPDSNDVRESVIADLEALLTRSRTPRDELFYGFEILMNEFQRLFSLRLLFDMPKWLVPGGQAVPPTLERDPAIQEIRERVGSARAERVIKVYVALCANPREWIPRPAVRRMGLPPTAVDGARKSSNDWKKGRPKLYSRDFLLSYVRSTWQPQSRSRVTKTQDPSRSTAIS